MRKYKPFVIIIKCGKCGGIIDRYSINYDKYRKPSGVPSLSRVCPYCGASYPSGYARIVKVDKYS